MIVQALSQLKHAFIQPPAPPEEDLEANQDLSIKVAERDEDRFTVRHIVTLVCAGLAVFGGAGAAAYASGGLQSKGQGPLPPMPLSLGSVKEAGGPHPSQPCSSNGYYPPVNPWDYCE